MQQGPRTDEREKLFKWAGPIWSIHVDLFKLKEKNLIISDKKELNNYTYGAIRGDIGELMLLNHGIDDNRISKSVHFDSILKMLLFNRVDMISYSSDVIHWLIKKNKYVSMELTPVYRLHSSDVYFAFNLSVSDEIVKEFQKALDEVKSDEKSVKEIFNKYLN